MKEQTPQASDLASCHGNSTVACTETALLPGRVHHLFCAVMQILLCGKMKYLKDA